MHDAGAEPDFDLSDPEQRAGVEDAIREFRISLSRSMNVARCNFAINAAQGAANLNHADKIVVAVELLASVLKTSPTATWPLILASVSELAIGRVEDAAKAEAPADAT